jgi:hypothetical protein
MYQLGIGAACTYVRTILDEVMSIEETGQLVDVDALDLHRLVTNHIIEAVVTTHNGASHLLVDGVVANKDEDFTAELDDKGVITITMLKDTLRVSMVKAGDSDVVVSELVPEDSAEGRKQLNKYVRGVADDPRVVLCKSWAGEYKPVLRYYSTNEHSIPEISLEYVPYPVIVESMVEICPRLEYAVLNELAAMVLNSLNEHEKATLYRAKSQAMMGVK